MPNSEKDHARTAARYFSPPRGPTRDREVAVLEVHVPDATGVSIEHLNRVAAAVPGWPVSKQRPRQVASVRAIGASISVRGFDIPATVWVEHGAQPGRIEHRSRSTIRARGERVPLSGRQSVLGGDSTGALLSGRNRRVVVGQDDERVGAGGVAQQPSWSGSILARIVRLSSCERDGDKGDQRQATGRHLLPQPDGVGGMNPQSPSSVPTCPVSRISSRTCR